MYTRAAAEVTGDRKNWRWIVQPHIVSKPDRRETRGMSDDATLSTHTHTHRGTALVAQAAAAAAAVVRIPLFPA